MGPRPRSEEDRELRKLLARASLYPLLTVLAVAAVLGWLLLRQARLAAWVDHTDIAIARGNEVGLLLIDRETSLRGYLLTRAPEFLQSYLETDRRLPAALAELDAFVGDNAAQVERVRRLRALATAWGEEARRALTAERVIPPLPESARARLEARRGLQEQARSELAAFTAVEDQLRVARAGQARGAQHLVLGATLALALGLGLTMAVTARAQLRRVAATFRRAAKAAEERGRALRESEERFRLFVEGVHDAAIYMLDPDGRVQSWNAGAERIQGYAPEEVLGHTVAMFYPASDAQAGAPARQLQEAARLGQVDSENWRVRKDGTRFWASVTVRALRGAEGRLVGFAKLVRDTTERKRADMRRAAELAVARTLAGAGGTGDAWPALLRGLVQALDGECGFTWEEREGALRTSASYLNPGSGVEPFAAQVNELRLPPGEAAPGSAWSTGQSVWIEDLRAAPEYPRAAPALAAGLHTLLAFPVHVEGRVALVVQLFAADPRKRDEELMQLCGGLALQIGSFLERQLLEDAARQAERSRAQELERRVQERTVELTAVNRELEAFSYSVSHDLRAPLRAMDGFSQVLLEDYGPTLDEAGRGYLGRIRAASQRMSQLIDDLIQLSRVTRSELRRESVDLSALFGEVVDEVRAREPGREVEVAVQPGLQVRGDARLLRAALENLVANAFKFTRRVAQPRVELGVREDPGERVFFVRDNGAGFDMAYASKLFQPFQRLHSMAEFEGTGIGLATLQRIVRRHGGRVWAEGAPEQGATFYFTLGDH